MEAWTINPRIIWISFDREGRWEMDLLKVSMGACGTRAVFYALQDVRAKLACWKQDNNQECPDRGLRDQAPAVFTASWEIPSDGKEKTVEMLEVLSLAILIWDWYVNGRHRPCRRQIPQVPNGLIFGWHCS